MTDVDGGRPQAQRRRFQHRFHDLPRRFAGRHPAQHLNGRGLAYTQSGPIINNTDVPQGQWQGLGAGAGNELGNIVARRDPATGQLTLYSIFQTPDSPTDNVSQGAASTLNFNRVTRRSVP